MLFKYKGKTYEVVELVEPKGSKQPGAHHDIIAIFEVKKNPDPKVEIPMVRLVNWFYGAAFFGKLDEIHGNEIHGSYGETFTNRKLLIDMIERAKNYQHFVP